MDVEGNKNGKPAPAQGAGAAKISREVRSAEDVIRRSLRLGSGMNQELSIVAKLL
jgi:hypothetical protein